MTRRGTIRAVAIGAGLVCLAAAARAQFSPGPLSRAHQQFEGPLRCTACHAVAAGSREFKCANCHTEIATRVRGGRGLHAAMVKNLDAPQACVGCHSEHNGVEYVPIKWDRPVEQFDHARTGYVLEGAHKRLECRRCHTPEHIATAARGEIRVKDLRRTWLGLSPQCRSCHEDTHRGQFASDCRGCHSMEAWKPASAFDHARAKFQLLGAHARVACEKCHARTGSGPKPVMKFVGLSFATCSGCHQDPHRGAFSARCENCHSVHTWKETRMAGGGFDHSKTAFPLRGKHAGLSCDKCHKSTNFKQAIAHQRCADCHREDPHRGQFSARADGGECGSCHVVDGWKPSTFVVARHGETRYALEGRHAALACTKCHQPAGAATVYRVKFERCTDCHADPHEAQFAAAPHGNRCEDCHTVRGFRPTTYTLARHAESGFRLEGAHAAVACAECHATSGAPKLGRYRIAVAGCDSCHRDPHASQFVSRNGGCEGCHSVRAWNDLAKFDHRATAFPLLGAHRAVLCGDCHQTPAGVKLAAASFRSTASRCSQCHDDVHRGEFALGAADTDCARCHDPAAWKPARFDHERDSAFPLTGAHAGVACSKCHKPAGVENGRPVRVFKPTPRECAACHGPERRS